MGIQGVLDINWTGISRSDTDIGRTRIRIQGSETAIGRTRLRLRGAGSPVCAGTGVGTVNAQRYL